MDVIPIVVSALALGVSALTAFVNFGYRGRLRVLDGPVYAMALQQDKVILTLALTFTNTGARRWPVRDVRLVAPAISKISMTWVASHEHMPGLSTETGRGYPIGFVVEPRSTRILVFEFRSGQPESGWQPAPFDVQVLVQPSRASPTYVRAADLTIEVDTGADLGKYLGHGNADEPVADADIVDSVKRLAKPDRSRRLR